MKELDKAAKAYEKEMYGYTVKKTIVDTDCSFANLISFISVSIAT